MATAQFAAPRRDLPAATVHSCGTPRRSAATSSEGSAVSIQRCLLAAELLPTANDHVAVLRLQFDEARLAAGLLARDQCRARSAERIEHGVAALAAVPDGALHQLDRLHRRVQVVDVRLLDEPHVALVAGAAPKVIRAFLPAVEDRFVLALVVGSPHRESVLRPDDESGPVPAASRNTRCSVWISDDDMQM